MAAQERPRDGGDVKLRSGMTRRRLVALGLLSTVAAVGERIGMPRAASAQADGVVLEDGGIYNAYVPTAFKEGQFDLYTCEFDAA